MQNLQTILSTPRLVLRQMDKGDYGALAAILQDEKAMYAYGHAFGDEEVAAWLANQQRRYQEDGFGLWAVCLAATGEMVGQCGITKQMWDSRQVPEIGYLFQRTHWHKGYATEAALGCKQYAFTTLGFDEVYSIIRNTNTASQKVARRLGMQPRGSFVKHYHGVNMPHIVFSVKRGE